MRKNHVEPCNGISKKEMSKLFRRKEIFKPLNIKDKLCSPFKKRMSDPTAPYDAYDESDDTEEQAKTQRLSGVGRQSESKRTESEKWMRSI